MVGFDWPSMDGVIEKIKEELDELLQAEEHLDREAELGDLLFSVVNLSRWWEIDAESALRAANSRFKQRFESIEAAARESGKDLTQFSLEEMNEFWNRAKDVHHPSEGE